MEFIFCKAALAIRRSALVKGTFLVLSFMNRSSVWILACTTQSSFESHIHQPLLITSNTQGKQDQFQRLNFRHTGIRETVQIFGPDAGKAARQHIVNDLKEEAGPKPIPSRKTRKIMWGWGCFRSGLTNQCWATTSYHSLHSHTKRQPKHQTKLPCLDF